MRGSTSITTAIASLYEAALTPALWPSALDAIVELFAADHAIAMIQHRETQAVRFLATTRIDPRPRAGLEVAAAAGIIRPFLGAAPSQTAVAVSALVPQAVLIRTDVFNDVVRPMNGYYGALVLPSLPRDVSGLFAVCRPMGREDFDKAEIRRLQILAPHIATAMRLRHRLAMAEAEAFRTRELLDRLDLGIVIVGTNGALRFVNCAAAAILRQHDGLSIDAAGVAGSTASATRALRQSIAAATDPERLGSLPEAAIPLPRPSLRQPLLVRVVPLGPRVVASDGMGEPAVALLIHDPERDSAIDASAIAAAFALTPREAEIAAWLARGADPAAIAETLGISRGTVRTHLKHLYDKTQTRRQGELIRLVLGLRG